MSDLPKLYKAGEWQDVLGDWWVADTSNLGGGSACWWVPARILGISLTDYILLLKDEYHASRFKFINYPEGDKRNSLLLFSFKNHQDAHRYLLYINRIARNKKFFI